MLSRCFRLALCAFSIVASYPALASPITDAEIPPALKPWERWVLHGEESHQCPLFFSDVQRRLCTWPSHLRLELSSSGGKLDYSVNQFAPGWLVLPGDTQHWPQDVRADGASAPTSARGAEPAIWLATGSHRITGSFTWGRLPQSLAVPQATGLIDLAVNGQSRANPLRDERGQLWLGKTQSAEAANANHISIKVYRLLEDSIPFRVTTHLDLEVSGAVRDEVIGSALLPDFIPFSVSTDLPARLDDDNRLHIQVRPGLWSVEVVGRAGASVSDIKYSSSDTQWPDEIWSLAAHNELRTVEVSGAPSIDPRQTQIPQDWRAYPAFGMKPRTTLHLAEKQRGSSQTEPDEVTLKRQMWLDFDGGGYTIQDALSGTIRKSWRLEAANPIELGQVQLDGEPQLITSRSEGAEGVEVRHGALNLAADSRVNGDIRRLPATGWNLELQGVSTNLHLPPGWRLIAAPGADNVPDTWVNRWTLLDLFVVLIATVAVFRLFGRNVGLLTLATLALVWHEPGAPRWAWLNLIAVVAIIKALPSSARTELVMRWLSRYRLMSAAVLVLIVVPFAIQQARWSLYPQLEQHNDVREQTFGASSVAPMNERLQKNMPAAPKPAPAAEAAEEESEMKKDALVRGRTQLLRKEKAIAGASGFSDEQVAQKSLQQLSPNVLVQTGPGLPGWSWSATELNWSGPVTADQSFRLVLLSPWEMRSLRIISILLIAALLFRLTDLKNVPLPRLGSGDGTTVTALILALMFAPYQAKAADASQPLPTPNILEELKARLLAPPDCAGACADIARLKISVAGDSISLRLSVDALTDVALPLPVPLLRSGDQSTPWQPNAVVIDGKPGVLQHLETGALLATLAKGRHEIVISGTLSGYGQLQLPMNPKPRRVETAIEGWIATGVNDEGVAGDAVQLLRKSVGGHSSKVASLQAMPPLFIVTRTLHMGLSWDIATSVERQGTTHAPAVVHIPLLPGEVVTEERATSKDGTVELTFAPGQTNADWSSRLPVTTDLALKAGSTAEYVEVWKLDVSPLWHVEISGIPAVSQQENQYWLPTYQPWPGESITLKISRPEGTHGQMLTLDGAQLMLSPGQRASQSELTLNLRASQGGPHVLTLPEGLTVQSVQLDGESQPAQQNGQKVTLNLHPGAQVAKVTLRDSEEISAFMRTPSVDLGLPGVNAQIHVELPIDRWVLLVGGPRLGPAVLFWGVLVVLCLIAAGLGRIDLTPLKPMPWVLLMLGLSQLPIWGAAIVVVWLFVLGLRGRSLPTMSNLYFNAMQIGILLLSAVALELLFQAVAHGLLGAPDMQIEGNESAGNTLIWYADRYGTNFPQAWILSVSIWVYRLLMLAWALWLANALIGWLRWGWGQISSGGFWRKDSPFVGTSIPPS